MRKPKQPTIITEAPYKGMINGQTYLIVPTNAGELPLAISIMLSIKSASK